MKIKLAIVTILSIVGIIICSSNYHSNDVMALEYSSSAGVSFTISPSISVSVSGDLIIDELAPGSSSDSNIIDVTVLSNNNTGYTLSSTIGSSTNNYTDLKLDGNSSDDTNKFTNLSTNKASLSNFDDNSWGYSYSTDSGTNWISGNTGSTANGYNGLPIYSSTGIKLVDTTAIGTNTIKFKIGAKASNTQAAGEYTNTVNFAAVGKAVPVSFYDAFKEAASQPGSNITMLNGYYKMQDMSTTICNNVYTSQLTDNSDTMEAQLIDVRDNNVYWVAKLKDNRCWLLENLKLNPTTTSLDDLQGNTNTPDTALYYFKNGGGSSPYATDAVTSTWNNYISGVDWTTPRINSEYKDAVSNNSYDQSGQWKIGIYYNYCAASAGSYCYPSDAGTGNADYDICSVNWHIPKVGGEYQALVNRYSNYADFRTIFRVPLSGNFESGQAYDQGQLGQFWTSTYYNTSSMHRLRIDSYSDINPTYAFSRSAGFAVRCIANN